MATNFNWWFILAPSFVLVAILLDAIDQLRLIREWDGQVGIRVLWCERKRPTPMMAGAKFLTLLVGAGSIAILVVDESWRGLLAATADLLGTTTGFFAIVAALLAYLLSITAYVAALFVSLDYGHFAVVALVYLANVAKLAVIALGKVTKAVVSAARSAVYVGRTMAADVLEPQESDDLCFFEEEVNGVFTTF